jgi:hypothetical protein
VLPRQLTALGFFMTISAKSNQIIIIKPFVHINRQRYNVVNLNSGNVSSVVTAFQTQEVVLCPYRK